MCDGDDDEGDGDDDKGDGDDDKGDDDDVRETCRSRSMGTATSRYLLGSAPVRGPLPGPVSESGPVVAQVLATSQGAPESACTPVQDAALLPPSAPAHPNAQPSTCKVPRQNALHQTTPAALSRLNAEPRTAAQVGVRVRPAKDTEACAASPEPCAAASPGPAAAASPLPAAAASPQPNGSDKGDLPDVLRERLEDCGHFLAFCRARIRDMHAAVMAAAKGKPPVLAYASARLQQDKQLVLAVFALNGFELRYASPDLRCDRDVVLAAVTQQGSALVYALPVARADKHVVRAACAHDAFALKYAAPELRMDATFVLDLMARGAGAGLRFASADVRDDEAVVRAATATCPWALSFASARVQRVFGQ